jgi:O-antigen ligase
MDFRQFFETDDDTRFTKAILLLLSLFLLSSAFSIALTQIGYFSALILWIGRMAVRRRFPFPRTPLDWFFVAFAVAEFLAMLFSIDRLYALLYLQRRLLVIPIVYVLLGNITSVRTLKTLLALMIISAVGVSLYSFIPLVMRLGDYLSFHRRLGEFQIYMTAGGIMMIALLLLLPFVVHRDTPRKVRILALVAMLPILINLYFTFTRSSWLGFIAGVIVIGLLRTRKLFAALVIVGALAFFLSTPELKEHRLYALVNPYHPDNLSRLHMWKVGMRVVHDYPLFGIGDIGMETIWQQYADPEWKTRWEGHMHNNIVQWLVCLGIAGFLTLVTLFVKAWLVVARIEKKLRGEWFTGSLALGGLAVFAGFHVNGLFEWNFGDAEIIMLVWATLGLVLAADKVRAATAQP